MWSLGPETPAALNLPTWPCRDILLFTFLTPKEPLMPFLTEGWSLSEHQTHYRRNRYPGFFYYHIVQLMQFPEHSAFRAYQRLMQSYFLALLKQVPFDAVLVKLFIQSRSIRSSTLTQSHSSLVDLSSPALNP